VAVEAAVGTGAGAVAVAVAGGISVVPGLIGVDCGPPHAEVSRVRSKNALKSRFFFHGKASWVEVLWG
jgi:hypothetical protein